jgi:CRISPR-associated protein Csd1
MSWMSDLVQTYDACESAAGLGDADKALLPVGHTLMKTQICITIDKNGKFIRAVEDEIKIIAPSNEEAEARTGPPKPYPLFDQLVYLSRAYSEDKYIAFVTYLQNWSSGNIKLEAVLKYIKSETILDDISSLNLKTKDGLPDKALAVRFSVEIPGDNTPNLWKAPEISRQWTNHYLCNSNNEYEICYISGKTGSRRAVFHPKNINNQTSNAKLISANDSENFTFRGRFTDSTEAFNVSYESSQKAHQALRWLIKNISYRCDSQAIVVWAVGETENDTSPKEADFNPFEDWYKYYADKQTDDETLASTSGKINRPYAEKVRNALTGFGNIDKLKHKRTIDVMAVDAATTGRMSVTFFETLPEDAYLETVAHWQETCAWYIPYTRKDGDKYEHGVFCGAPSADDIINAVHGEKCDDRIKKYERSRLLHCVFRGAKLPSDMVTSALNNASTPEHFNSDSRWQWEKTLKVACALTRKKIFDKSKELYSMVMDQSNTDRSYLWGRLLALAERIETHARFEQGVADTEKRPTNALRLMSAFKAHPFRTWNTLFDQLQPYRERLNGAEWYQKQIDSIMNLFKPGEYEDNKPLDGKYLLGYSLERMELQTKNKKTEENTNELTEEN